MSYPPPPPTPLPYSFWGSNTDLERLARPPPTRAQRPGRPPTAVVGGQADRRIDRRRCCVLLPPALLLAVVAIALTKTGAVFAKKK